MTETKESSKDAVAKKTGIDIRGIFNSAARHHDAKCNAF